MPTLPPAPHSPSRRRFLALGAGAGAAFAIAPFVAVRGVPAAAGGLRAVALRTESATDPLGLDEAAPRLSWQLASTSRGVMQAAYRIRVASSPDLLAGGIADLWDSGKVRSGQSIGIAFAGKALRSRQCCHWQVCVWEEGGAMSGWSAPARWEMGLLDRADWTGDWIGHRATSDAAPALRTRFRLAGPVRQARLYIAAVGYHEAAINGRRVGDHVLDPACTDYDKRVLYVVHDVTALVAVGDNVLGIELGRGFFDVPTTTAWAWTAAPWKAAPRALVQLEVIHADGTSTSTIASGAEWRATDGPTRFDSVYAGETYDATLAPAGWTSPGFDDSAWPAASVVDAPRGRLVAQAMEPIRVVGSVPAVAVKPIAPGVHVFDFGQTVAGWARLRMRGRRGTRVTLEYAQQLKPDGTVDLEQGYVKGGRFQRDEYVFSGDGLETWQPRFSHKSFRYVQVAGLDGEASPDMLLGQEVRTDVAPAAGFRCSDPTYNRIHAMATRSLGHHLLGFPAVDVMYEKIGWTADAQLNVPSMAVNFGCQRFLSKWLDDLADSQTGEGNIPVIVPSGGWGYPAQSTEWKAAFPIVMWELHRRFGDRRALSRHYAGVARYVRWELGRLDASGLALTDLGDWLAPGGYTQPPEDTRLTATAYLYRDLHILAGAADILGFADDATVWRTRADELGQRFNATFLDRQAGHYRTAKDPGYRQCSNALPLAFGLVPRDLRAAVAASLVADIRSRGNHLDTGALGTAVLLPVLVQEGYADVAHAIATQHGFPSWGFWLDHGADTLWETWELKQAGQGRPPSHDHYLFGSVDAWFFEHVAGITATKAGYESIRIQPLIDGPLAWAEAWMDLPQGRVALGWHRQADGAWRMSLEVPPNVSAELHLPHGVVARVGSGRHGFTQADVSKAIATAIQGPVTG